MDLVSAHPGHLNAFFSGSHTFTLDQLRSGVARELRQQASFMPLEPVSLKSPNDFAKLFARFELGAPTILVDPRLDLPKAKLTEIRNGLETKNRPPDARALVGLFTSGTTSEGKCIFHSASSLANIVLSIQSVVERETNSRSEPRETRRQDAFTNIATLRSSNPINNPLATSMSLSSVSGLALALRAIFTGGGLLLPDEYDLAAFNQGICSIPGATVALSPASARSLLNLWRTGASVRPRPLSVALGGSKVPVRVAEQLHQFLDCIVTIGYGTTETGPVTASSLDGIADIRAGTVGTPLAGVNVAIGSQTHPAHHAGEGAVVVESGSLLSGFVKDGVYREVDRHTAWQTGDLGRLSNDGRLTICGRADWMIIRGGRLIDPAVIEGALDSIPAVMQALVYGRPSRVEGEDDVCALIVAAEPGVTLDAVRKSLVAILPASLVPRHLSFVSHLPMTVDGAVRRGLTGSPRC
ncbi:MAG: class I adenylate-forming enzyme family protein [Acidimicrobiales bacterium]